ncbi:MAG: squalene/phytoene synthase family protein, partial [Planctomycetota bacterium]
MEATHPGGLSPQQRTFIKPTPAELERGAKQSVKSAREHFGQWMWAFRNLPKEQYQAVCGLAHLLQLAQAASLERKDVPKTEAPCDQLREDLSDAFVGRYVSAPLYFLADVVAKFRIPKQFIFEPLEACDRHWRFRQPATEQEMLATATRLGGALMRQLVHVLGIEQPGFEQAALKTGQGLTLTWWLLHLADDVRADKLRLAKSDFFHICVESKTFAPKLKALSKGPKLVGPLQELKHLHHCPKKTVSALEDTSVLET